MKVLVMGGGADSTLINLILRAASIACCEVVVKDEDVDCDFIIGAEPGRIDLDLLNAEMALIPKAKDISECYLSPQRQTFTPHYAKQNKRGKFKRSGR